jgi:decaprenyl-phosphate phosphoribosyltransferase
MSLPLARRSSLRGLLLLMRPDQWVKNAFVVAPLFFAPSHVTVQSTLKVLLGAICFSALASAVYILNDYFDREGDRMHPVKCTRPLAAGTVAAPAALMLMVLLGVSGLALAMMLSTAFGGVGSVYILTNLVYSLWLKHVAIIDVLLVSFGFVLRVEGGSILAGVEPSVWIIIMTGLLALFLAFGKRRDDLVNKQSSSQRGSLQGYNQAFLDTTMAMLLGALLVAYLIYTTDRTVMARMGTDQLYLTAPFVLAGILRYLQLVLVEERSGSPTLLVLTDPFLICTIIGWIATFAIMLYA